MTIKQTLSIHQPEDVLGYIPHLLGYWPRESLVAITMQGKALGATLRVDLPPADNPHAHADFAAYVRNQLLADERADGVLLALYSAAGWDDGSVLDWTMPLLGILQEALAPVDLTVRDAWLIGDDYWRSAFCTDLSCCPVPGLPLERIHNSRISAEMVYRGSTVGAAPDSTVDPPKLALPGRPAVDVLEAEQRFEDQLLESGRSECCFDAVLDAWAQVLERCPRADGLGPSDIAGAVFGGPAGSELMGFLRATLAVPAWRDAVIVMAAADVASAKAGGRAFDLFSGDNSSSLPFDPLALGLAMPPAAAAGAASNGRSPEETGDTLLDGMPGVPSYGGVLLGEEPEIPDWRLLDSLGRILSALSYDDEEGGLAAAALTLQGWVAWAKGNGSLAHASLLRAAAAHPGYRLADLLDDVLGQGTICGWARRPESAWGTYKASRN
ncbi:DUF4192 domain-containing protein [Paenarthrobacter ureafaciens]|uniref:DUF4192 domain-containing protein n=1 Tax=Paenarthrobacter ureafaciens TaxID=37931 RepID=UPI0015BCD49D|nr:DUF4192 domain-containing protein [Paenarthrobacter ureafaciens]MEC3852334.1 DUF4192 domain-containing protein [Paenarthrobacter ureafaciens]NWL29044.1 DUF4192 domain-containing protein [Paenarthrobacter ureafaciens]